jgi:F-type H+-transporting ATPase subunit delta
MNNRLSAKRHAKALFESISEKPDGEKMMETLLGDLEKTSRLIQDPTLAGYLNNPTINLKVKFSRLNEALGNVHPLILNLLGMLISKSNMHLLPSIALDYRDLIDHHHGILRAKVKSAVPLDENDRSLLIQRLQNMMGKKIVLETTVEPRLIGGLIVRVSDKLIDGSTKAMLSNLKQAMGTS